MDNNDFFNEPKDKEKSIKTEDNNKSNYSEFSPNQPTTGYNPPPTNRQDYAVVKKRDTATKVLYILLAIFGVIFIFFAGFLTKSLTEDKEVAAFKWALSEIDKYYIGDEVEGQHYTKEDYIKNGFGLLDRYSAFITPSELESLINSQQGQEDGVGIGISIKEVDGKNYVCISNVVLGSPAENKVFEGDLLIKVNGVTVDPNDIGGTISGALTGVNETFVVKRPTYNSETQELEYNEITTQVEYKQYDARYLKYYDSTTEFTPNRLPDKTAYILFREFNRPVDTEFISAMNKFKQNGNKNLVLDMRGNPGGYLDILQILGGYLVGDSTGKAPVMMTTVFKNGSTTTDNAVIGAYSYNQMGFDKIVVLVDDNSASASEVLLGAMIDHGTCDYIIGNHTYGKGLMQMTTAHRQSGYALRITTARWFTPNGTWVQEKRADGTKGILPNKAVQKNANNYPYSFDNDFEYQAAIDYIIGK